VLIGSPRTGPLRSGQVLTTVRVVSEHQSYEVAAVDGPLDERRLAAARALSTRVRATRTSFVNTYEGGSFTGDPHRMARRYYDAFRYLANWGTHELIPRFAAWLTGLEVVRRYRGREAVSAWGSGGPVVRAAVSEEEADLGWGGGVLAWILPMRAEVLAGVEPPVASCLDALTGSPTALVEFPRIDGDLVGIAAGGSTPRRHRPVDVASWAAATSRRAGCEPAATVRQERVAAEGDWRAAQTRRERLAELTAQFRTRGRDYPPRSWGIASRDRTPTAPAQTVSDPREVIGGAEFTGRVEAPRDEHRRKSVLIGQFAAAGL
jgi:hypothetical protein